VLGGEGGEEEVLMGAEHCALGAGEGEEGEEGEEGGDGGRERETDRPGGTSRKVLGRG